MAVADPPTAAAPVKQLRSLRGDPDALFDVPVLEKGEDFKPADKLEDVVRGLIGAFPDRLGTLAPLTIRVMWQAHGRTARGREILGKASRPSGISKFLLEDVDFLLYVAADHCRNLGMTNYTMEAELFNLLCQCFVDAEGKPMILGPDFSGFTAELRAYGTWNEELKIGGRAFRDTPVQLSLIDVDEDDVDEDDVDEDDE